MTTFKPGAKVTVPAFVESAGHDDAHVIVKVGRTPVQVSATSVGAVPDWWIATDQLAKGGKKILGPFVTRELALEVRRYVEAVQSPVTYWVDSESRESPGA